ncbi:metallophosphoesterase [Deinococcus sp. YIM 77859]|uniref:metallophosphoesterase n=1 Tax=Deinococcus sp. YIM 77859 TaxID=1540221 RepID=UPI000557336F|nr:metallophosphoesterase [Deinococcus sp. YIM 77859]
MQLFLPELALVVLMGTAADRHMFAARHFQPEEVLGGDGVLLDPLLEQAGERLAQGQRTVVNLPGFRPHDRRRLVELARAHDVAAVALVLDLPQPLRQGRPLPETELRRTLGSLEREGFGQVWVLRSAAEVNTARVNRVPLPVDRRALTGPFDFIGDVHGCRAELDELLKQLGYTVEGDAATPPPGRTAVFLGDLTDRGPNSAGVLRLVMNLVRSGAALCVLGNHDEKLRRALEGKAVRALHGLDATLAQVAAAGPGFREEVRAWLGSLPSHLVLDGGRVVAAHAGLPERYQGRVSGRVQSFALYGDVNGRRDEYGLPIRGDWAQTYRGAALVVYGHTPVLEPRWLNRTVNIDTGCVFGGALTALRYPKLETVSVAAHARYAVPRRPLESVPGTPLAP